MNESEIGTISDRPLTVVEEALLDAAAEAEIDAGRGVSHARVREWLAKRGKGERLPLPVA